jgi:UDP-2,4-diacetamido-2,4,6-trideoxy-beta-L-altropyranose hydrolase
MCTDAPKVEHRVKSEGMQIIHLSAHLGSADDALQTAALARGMDASWVVVDGYHFGAEYEQLVKAAGLRLLVIDDNGHADRYHADIVLNQNLHAHEGLYANREYYTRLLLGPHYVLLRREFWSWRDWRREIPEVARRVLVTMGGGDRNNLTLMVIEALEQIMIDGLDARVLVGGSNPRFEELQSAIRDFKVSIRLERNVTNIPELVAWADVAVSAAGTTAWELAFMGVPSLFLIQADNQRETAERLDALGVASNLGRPTELSCDKLARELVNLMVAADRRTEMARLGRQLVDGEGATRVLMHLNAEPLHIRTAREDDCQQLWKWANDPDVRAVSFSSEQILWEQHIEWFRSKLNNSACVLQIATCGEIPAGQIRYDLDGDQAVVSISLDREFRGKGYGSLLIWRSAQALFDTTTVTTIHAYVKQANEISVRAFEKAGYRNVERTTAEADKALHLVLNRSGNNAT